jgi:hypothetical protein
VVGLPAVGAKSLLRVTATGSQLPARGGCHVDRVSRKGSAAVVRTPGAMRVIISTNTLFCIFVGERVVWWFVPACRMETRCLPCALLETYPHQAVSGAIGASLVLTFEG